MDFNTWLAFFAACWLISLSPGAGAIKSMSTGLRYGYRKGVFNILGLQLGVVFLVVVAAVGLGALLAASALAFSIVKWCGVAYLVWLGVAQWRLQAHMLSLQPGPGTSLRRLVLEGFLVNASNPKGVIFMLAVLPQFVDPAKPLLPQYLICTASLVATDVVVMSGYTLLASRVLRTLRQPRQVRWLNRCFGGLFMAAGALLAGFRRVA